MSQNSSRYAHHLAYILVVISCGLFRNSVFGVTPNILDVVFVMLIPHIRHMIPVTVIPRIRYMIPVIVNPLCPAYDKL